ncbi:EVE domain-containing protein [Halobacteriaceae bacterium SHR40]|uniref:EVE domain-containing protein n=1 Tax=Halovenus amylolytica TaxID=2500550 RepID=UPI000FE2B8B3
MSDNLFRVTVDEPNYGNVLGTPPTTEKLRTANLVSLEGSRLWAQRNSENGQQVYETMESGDGLLFYKVKRGIASDEGMYVGTARVENKHRLNEEQAKALFQTPVATLAYTVTGFTEINKSIQDVKAVLGYKSYPQSSHRVTDDRYTSVDNALQTLTE